MLSSSKWLKCLSRITISSRSYIPRKEKLMRLGCLVVITLLIFASTKAQNAGVPEPQPFSISSLNTPFAMQGVFEGEYRIDSGRLELKITKAEISISEHCPYKGRRLLSAVKFGLATTTDDKRWKIAHAAPELFLEQVMRPRDTYSLGELYFYIPLDDSIDLSKHWLVVQMEDTALDVAEEKPQKGYAFAHSCRDIFTRKK
jgi:hypothetical protein